mmetsp:Transcript_53579/g.170400  ORF Transcript_53579/g.170400 Transcript_53579/m.170400 type:complete len:227 (-) Transcript_53579:676-1356(-)
MSVDMTLSASSNRPALASALTTVPKAFMSGECPASRRRSRVAKAPSASPSRACWSSSTPKVAWSMRTPSRRMRQRIDLTIRARPSLLAAWRRALYAPTEGRPPSARIPHMSCAAWGRLPLSESLVTIMVVMAVFGTIPRPRSSLKSSHATSSLPLRQHALIVAPYATTSASSPALCASRSASTARSPRRMRPHPSMSIVNMRKLTAPAARARATASAALSMSLARQ